MYSFILSYLCGVSCDMADTTGSRGWTRQKHFTKPPIASWTPQFTSSPWWLFCVFMEQERVSEGKQQVLLARGVKYIGQSIFFTMVWGTMFKWLPCCVFVERSVLAWSLALDGRCGWENTVGGSIWRSVVIVQTNLLILNFSLTLYPKYSTIFTVLIQLLRTRQLCMVKF